MFAAVAYADQDPVETVVISVENDFFIAGPDNNYTNGVSLTWASDKISLYDDESFVPRWARFGSFLPGFDPDLEQSYVSFSLIHEMNTPTDITLENPPLNDQPYSGVLLLGATFFSKSERWASAWDLRVGAVGPVTQADHIQIVYHDLIGADEPLGWDTQLRNEVLLNAGYTGAYTLLEDREGLDENWRVTVLGNAEVGTYLTAIGSGALLEFGNDLQDTIATSSLGQGLGSGVGLGSTPLDEFNWAFYTGFAGYYVGHYLPLDGTLFRDSRSVDSEPFIVTGSFGVTLRYQKLIASVGISAGATPLEDQDDDIDYGAVSLGWHF